ncbi:hypothetical protein GQL56_28435 [Pseudomonas putida]|nr:hypothetical protein [Pseudomonas putida]
MIDIEKVLHELDTLPARVNAKLVVAEVNGSGVHKKTDREVQLEVTAAWKKLVADRKKTKGVC